MSLIFASIPQKRLLAGITSASSTFYVNNILSWDGETDIVPADLGSQHYICIRNDTGTIVEFCEIDPATISTGPITLVRRGLSYYGDLTTETTALKLDWPSGSIVQFGTDVSQIFQWLKEYIDGISIAGAPDASTTAKGFAEEATQAEVDAGTAAGSAARLFINPSTHRGRKYNDAVASAVGTDAYAITIAPAITAYATYQEFTFIADVANTTDATLNVSGLGAKTIKKNVSIALETGDILSGQVVKVMYDGTNMQLVSTTSVVMKMKASILTTGEAIDGSTTPVPVFVSPAATTAKITTAGTGTTLTMKGSGDMYALAFQFTGAAADTINKITVSLLKSGSPGDISVKLYNDSGSNTIGTLLQDMGTILASNITTSFTSLSLTIGSFLTLPATFWVVIRGSATQDASNWVSVQDSTTGTQLSLYDSNGSSNWLTNDVSCTSNIILSSVYTAGLLYKSDANNTDRDEFDGFLIENKAVSETTQIVIKGVQGSFSGLTVGVEYFISDTIGTIATSGTGSIPVGKAISTTEILII